MQIYYSLDIVIIGFYTMQKIYVSMEHLYFIISMLYFCENPLI